MGRIKLLALAFCVCLFADTPYGQILQTRVDIIKDKGYNYTNGVTDDGTRYIRYDTKVRTEASGVYTMTKVYYFMNLDNGKEVCYMWKIIEPSSETNSNVSIYKSKYVEVGYMQWKDYENSIIYDIEVKDGLCIISAGLDFKK